MKHLTFVLLILLSFHSRAGALQDKNKAIVRDFFELAFNQHKTEEAVKKHMGAKYIQHNPYAGNGPKAFLSYFETFYKKNPKSHLSIKRMIAEDDLVVVHSHSQRDDKDTGYAVVDIMRLEKGKLVEHFDVLQEVPPQTLNGNTMFEGKNDQ